MWWKTTQEGSEHQDLDFNNQCIKASVLTPDGMRDLRKEGLDSLVVPMESPLGVGTVEEPCSPWLLWYNENLQNTLSLCPLKKELERGLGGQHK